MPAYERNAAPFLHGPEYDAAAEAMRAGQYGHNTATEKFEAELAAFLGVPDVVTTSRCTAALHLALRVAGIGPGDDVVVPSQTFCATIQAIQMAGANPRFADIDPNTLCVTADTVSAALTPRTRAVMPVLYGGRAVDLTTLTDTFDQRGIVLVEDAAHAFGSYQAGTPVGATGAMTCFSFGPIKNLTCLEGGALIPRTPAEADIARALRLLGVTQSQAARIRSTSYQVDGPGLPYHLSAVHAAVGRIQLHHFPAVAATRKTLWRTYAHALDAVDNAALVDVDPDHSVPFNAVVRIPHREQVFELMRGNSIGVGVHYPPNHLQPAFAAWHRSLPATETTASQILSLPFHPAMTEYDVHHVVSALDTALHTAGEPS